jgi:hypothetical protein
LGWILVEGDNLLGSRDNLLGSRDNLLGSRDKKLKRRVDAFGLNDSIVRVERGNVVGVDERAKVVRKSVT